MSGNVIGKMVLGTAQLGMDYGITNRAGKPSKEEAFKILETAWNGGIKRYDTAPGYGSENIIGDFIKANGIENEINILTKIPSLKDLSDWKGFIHRTINNSLKNLSCRSIEVLFFHNANNSNWLLKEPGFFNQLVSEYPISNLGVSVYDMEQVEKLKNCEFDIAFQFPYNILDRRFESNNISTGLRYARSIFLQGVLSSKTGLRDSAPETLKEIHKKVRDLFEEKQIIPVNYSLQFVANSRSIDYFLFGVDAKEQLDQIFAVDLLCYHPDDELNQIISAIDKEWLDPRVWN